MKKEIKRYEPLFKEAETSKQQEATVSFSNKDQTAEAMTTIVQEICDRYGLRNPKLLPIFGDAIINGISNTDAESLSYFVKRLILYLKSYAK